MTEGTPASAFSLVPFKFKWPEESGLLPPKKQECPEPLKTTASFWPVLPEARPEKIEVATNRKPLVFRPLWEINAPIEPEISAEPETPLPEAVEPPDGPSRMLDWGEVLQPGDVCLNTFLTLVDTARQDAGLSWSELGRRLGMKQSVIMAFQARSAYPTVFNFVTLAVWAGVDLRSLKKDPTKESRLWGR